MLYMPKKRRIFFISVAMFLTALIGANVCSAKENLIILVSNQDYQNCEKLISDMNKYEVPYTRIDESKIEEYKNEKYMFILGGPGSGEGMDAVFKKVLSRDEYSFLQSSGNMDMYLKEDVWVKGQNVMVLGVSDGAQLKDILIDFRPAWMGNLVDWFDLDVNWAEYVY